MSNEKYFIESDKDRFIKQYIVSFMASYTADKYEEMCVNDNHKALRQPPVEDAHHLAEEAWGHMVEVIGVARIDNRSEGNKIGNTFVYVYLSSYEGEKITGGGFYRVDVSPDVAMRFGASSFENWDDFEAHEGDNGNPNLFVIKNDDSETNQFGL